MSVSGPLTSIQISTFFETKEELQAAIARTADVQNGAAQAAHLASQQGCAARLFTMYMLATDTNAASSSSTELYDFACAPMSTPGITSVAAPFICCP